MDKTKPPRTRFDVVLNEQLARDFDELARGARIVVREEGQPDRQLIAL